MQIDKFATANVHFVNKDLLDLKWVDSHDLIAPQSLRITGEAIITIDVINPVLRETLMNVRIIRDLNNISNNATLADLDSTSDIESATLFYEPAAIYPTSTVSVRYEFAEEGHYIGFVTAHKPDFDDALRSLFPFSIGVGKTMT